MVLDNNSELYAKQQSLLAELRKIVGNKKLMFSKSYIDSRKGEYDTIGNEGRHYFGITRKSVLCPCRVVYSNDPFNKEYGAYIKKYSLYRYFDGQNVDKIALEDLFVKDLEKIVKDIKFFLFWEANVHLPTIKLEYDKCLELKSKYDKIKY